MKAAASSAAARRYSNCTASAGKWIKQHLRIKAFFGHNENAVKTQIWIAFCACVLIAIARKHLQLEHHRMYEILQILSLSMFENTPINQLLANTPENSDADLESNQLNLTDPSVSEAFLRQVAGMK